MSIMLVSLSTVKSFLDIATATTDYDELINIIIQHVSDRIQTFLNRRLKKEQRTQYFQAGRRKYYVDAYPVDDTTTVTVVLDETTQTINDDYYLWPDEGLFEFDSITSYIEPKQILITWTGGYASSTVTVAGASQDILLAVPDALKFACLLQTAFVFRRRKDVGLSSLTMPDGSVSTIFAADLLPEVKNILRSYRKSPMGY